MARVTVEDCVKKVEDRFELVVLAAERANRINSGAHLTLERDNDKDSVVALREIAAGNIDINLLRDNVISRLQKRAVIDEPEEDYEVREFMEEDMAYVPASEEFEQDESDFQGMDMDFGSFDDISEEDSESEK
jgi:DNA-directed RNA polymerase subunit omega